MQLKQRNIQISFCFDGLKAKPTFKMTDDFQKDLNNREPYYSLLQVNNS